MRMIRSEHSEMIGVIAANSDISQVAFRKTNGRERRVQLEMIITRS